ncbi:MAG TPA: molecular chaperone TorD family protein [Pyrinomonadaceae bacterium]|jgi:TorA maturation chaperone TorD
MEIFRALAVLAEPPTAETARVAAALDLGAPPAASVYTELFLLELYPYASVYLGAEGMLGGAARDLVAGFWRALGEPPPAEPDHIAVLLALYAHVAELHERERAPERAALWQQARRALLWEHLLSWLPCYLAKLSDLAPPFYARWAELVTTALRGETEQTGPLDALPLHLRAAPALVDPRTGTLADFLQSLLAPVRSGLILTRADLQRAARGLGVGTRIGTRAFSLQALLAQDAPGTLDWLAREAADWTTRHPRHFAGLGNLGAHWAARADATARLLAELKLSIKDLLT